MPDAVIGPNAIIQIVAAARDQLSNAQANMLLREAGLDHYIAGLPSQMVPELEVAALHSALYRTNVGDVALRIATDAGVRTADYLLVNRIPAAAGLVLRYLPGALSARFLLAAISRHAWTFAGSGAFQFSGHGPVSISLSGSPLFADGRAAPLADAYFRATFQRLFQVLVHSRCTCRDDGDEPAKPGSTRFA
ncbi:MAG: bacteriochlorophyll 4-vinyl reductase, partial [Pseudomonadota bacterium]